MTSHKNGLIASSWHGNAEKPPTAEAVGGFGAGEDRVRNVTDRGSLPSCYV